MAPFVGPPECLPATGENSGTIWLKATGSVKVWDAPFLAGGDVPLQCPLSFGAVPRPARSRLRLVFHSQPYVIYGTRRQRVVF